MSQTGLARDASIAMTGASLTVLAKNGNRQFLALENPKENANDIGVNITGGAAVLGGAGTLTLSPGQAFIFDHWVAQNAINAIGTSTQILVAIEG